MAGCRVRSLVGHPSHPEPVCRVSSPDCGVGGRRGRRSKIDFPWQCRPLRVCDDSRRPYVVASPVACGIEDDGG